MWNVDNSEILFQMEDFKIEFRGIINEMVLYPCVLSYLILFQNWKVAYSECLFFQKEEVTTSLGREINNKVL